MEWFFRSSQQISTTVICALVVLVVLPFLPSLLRLFARLLQPSGRHQTDAASSKLVGATSESGFEPGNVPLYSAAVVDAQAQNTSSGTASGSDAQSATKSAAPASPYQESPSPTAIIAEVCSLQSPAREGVAQGYCGHQVRWKLHLDAISEQEQGALHTVRMFPSTRSAFACAVYFGVNLDEHPELQAAQKEALFMVEGTIANVEDYDIDLKDIHAIAKAA